MTSLESAFANFVMDRTDAVGVDSMQDAEHKQLRSKVKEIRREIITHLPPEMLNLLNDYDSNNNLMGAIEVDYAYRQGLKDGPVLKNLLGAVN